MTSGADIAVAEIPRRGLRAQRTDRLGATLLRATLAMLAVFAGSLALAGCTGSLLGSGTAVAEAYRLDATRSGPAAAAPAISPTPALALAVDRPRAPDALDTDRIAVVPGGSRFDYYADVKWAEPAPLMLQQNLVAALEASGRYAGVVAAPARLPAELMLDVELRHFEATAAPGSDAPIVHVQVQASLIDLRRAQRVTSIVSEARVAAGTNRRGAIVQAFERANAQVVNDVATRVGAAAGQLSPP